MQIKNRLSIANADTKYLRLDATNDPMQADLDMGSHGLTNLSSISGVSGEALEITSAPSQDIRFVLQEDPGLNRTFNIYNADDEVNIFTVSDQGGFGLYTASGNGFVIVDYETQMTMYQYMIPGYGYGFNVDLDMNSHAISNVGNLSVNGNLDHNGSYVGFYGATPVVRASGWSAANYSEIRSLDGDTATVGDIFNALATLIDDIKNTGLIGG